MGENIVGSTALPDSVRLIVLAAMAGGLVAVMFAFFSEKFITSQWGVALKHPIADDLELYLEKSHLGVKRCELAESAGLATREGEILLLTARGGRLPQIANELCISHNTVKTRIRRIYNKLDISSRKELIVLLGVRKGSEMGAAPAESGLG